MSSLIPALVLLIACFELDGMWSCSVHAPLGTGCNWVCDPEARE
jgi:hypothetical protein